MREAEVQIGNSGLSVSILLACSLCASAIPAGRPRTAAFLVPGPLAWPVRFNL